ncbi:laccase abr2 [Colletotrichum spaethianum]|uniref:Laccase abr2 n=1 Tax=Colletotrichum spaethianum TaxID=700344 RepID=A0AA37P872_9PEZI|nr:laccase abr2 [Colletotrichum spaethianum]GKT47435.1 laccase abr2 [Colletotrichum spaethianum]
MYFFKLLSWTLHGLSPNWDPAPLLKLGNTELESTIRNHVRFEIHLTAGQVDALGAGPRDAILINGSFTGPTLRLNQGDEVEFLVRNYLREDTTVHFHGVDQRKTPWSDGVPGLTQGQIRPGASYLYRWKAEQPGTFFYHAHSKGQLMDGLYGAIIVDAAQNVDRPFHLIDSDPKEEMAMRAAESQMQPLLLSDWSQYKFDDFYHIEKIANFDLACTDAIIVNGMGSQYCLDPESLDSMTNPVILKMLQDLGEDHMTAKGCVPPIQALQGDFDVNIGELPTDAIRKCVGGWNPRGNFTFTVDSRNGWAALTFINVGGLYPLQVSIDNHDLHVYAVDGQYIRPTVTDRVYVGNGNRVSVMVKLNQERALYTVRMANDLLNQILGGFANMAYDGANEMSNCSKPKMNYAGQPLIKNLRSFKPEEGRPFPARTPSRRSNRTFKLHLRKPGRPHGAYEWSLSGHEVYNMTREQQDPPFLFLQPDEIPHSELVLRTHVGEWIDLILETEGPFAQSHPVHKHGNKVYFLGSGTGKFPWHTVEEAQKHLPPGSFNFKDPSYLDTFTTPDIAGDAPAVWTVVRYKADNPGTWLLHCHVQTHHAGGMGVVMLDGISQFPKVPTDYVEWNGFNAPL